MDLPKLLWPANASEFWTAAAAVGTLLAVVVAAFLPEIRRIWHRPKLVVRAALKAPDCQLVGANYLLRIWVINTGKQAAENVQVFAADLMAIADGFDTEGMFLPQNLKWNDGSTFLDRMNPGMGAYCQLSTFLQKPATTAGLRLDLETLPVELPEGSYMLALKVAGSNTYPTTTIVEIDIKGPWDRDPKVVFRERLGFKVFKS
jgi:hypothetical protein